MAATADSKQPVSVGVFRRTFLCPNFAETPTAASEPLVQEGTWEVHGLQNRASFEVIRVPAAAEPVGAPVHGMIEISIYRAGPIAEIASSCRRAIHWGPWNAGTLSNVRIPLPLERQDLLDPAKGWLHRDGSLLCELAIFSLSPGVTAADGTLSSTKRLLLEHPASRSVLETPVVGGAGTGTGTGIVTVTPSSRQETRTFVLRDFPTIALLPYCEHATLATDLCGGTTSVRLCPNGALLADHSSPDDMKGRLVLDVTGLPAGLVGGDIRVIVRRQHPPGAHERTFSWTATAQSSLCCALGLSQAEVVAPANGWLTQDGDRSLVVEVTLTCLEGTVTGTREVAERDVAVLRMERCAEEVFRSDLSSLLPFERTLVAHPDDGLVAAAAAGAGASATAFSDAVLLCDGERFPVHRAILAARSAVFRGMFASGMRECRSGEAKVAQVRPVALRELLHFFYTGRLSTPPFQHCGPEELYAAAHYYQATGLTDLLEAHLLAETPAPEALPTRLRMANLYNLPKLKLHYARLLQGNIQALSLFLDTCFAASGASGAGGDGDDQAVSACPASVSTSSAAVDRRVATKRRRVEEELS